MGYTVRIDRDTCIGSGMCASSAPEAFALDDENRAVVLDGISQLTDERIVEIAQMCPSGAIILVDEEGNELDPFEV